MNLSRDLLLILALLQFTISLSLQSIRIGRTQNNEARCSLLLASTRVDLLNDTVLNLRDEPISIVEDFNINQAENTIQSSLGYQNQYESTTHDDFDRRKEDTSPRATRSLQDQDEAVHHEQDDRHDDIVDSLVRHYCSIQRPFDGQGGDDDSSDHIHSTAKPGEEHNRRANVQLPPGWGKTQLALETLSTLYLDGIGPSRSKLGSAIYVTPYLKLVDQVLEQMDRFGTLAEIPHSRLIVASQTNRTETCTTCVDKIASFLSSKNDKMPLIICTYDSLPKVGEAIRMLNESIGFGIFDEAHMMEGVGELSGYGLYDSKLPVDYRLFLTATPRRYTKSPKQMGVLGSKLDKDGALMLIPEKDTKQKRLSVRSFCDESLFGPCIERRTMRESVEQNITVPITLCALDRDEIRFILGENYNYKKLLSKDSLLPFAVRAAFHKLNVSRAVSFHSMNSRAKAFTTSSGKVFGKNIAAYAVSGTGTMSAAKREEVLSSAKMAPKSIVSNCKVLATGVDEADWELAVMADPVRSPVAARQMIGRVSRKSPGKERGYVLVPLVMDGEYGMLEDALEGSSGYEMFTLAFEAMVGLDPELRQDVLFVINESAKLGRPLDETEFPSRVIESFMLPSGMPLEMKNAIMNRAIAEYGGQSSWDYMFDLLLAYRDRKGNCNVPRHHNECGKNLGFWLNNQRQLKKEGKLDFSRDKRLTDIGVVWDVFAAEWEESFELLVKFKQRKGHCNVPSNHKEEGKNLGHWLMNQRKWKKEGKLEHSREEQLADIGVVWDVHSDKWEENFKLLTQYKQRKGHCNVPSNHKEEGKNLGSWLHTQKKLKKQRKLDAFREKRLSDIGVVWDVFAAAWEENFKHFVQFKQCEGHCNVPKSHKEDGKNLGNWLHTQRKLKRKGKLDNSREKRLSEMGIRWSFL